MSSVTTWNRLEPLARTDDLQESLQARIADPLWLLARQWQFAEFQGEDTGSPIRLQLQAQAARISRYHAGAPGVDAADRAVDHSDADLPLEPLVEREAVFGSGPNERLAADMGLHFLRLLARHGVPGCRQLYLDAYAFPRPAVPADDSATTELRQLLAGRVPDGFRLHSDLVAHRGAAASLGTLPATPAIAAGDQAGVLAAANAWLGWMDGLATTPDADDAWQPRRLEYACAVQADLPQGRVMLQAEGYPGGRLDWFDFDAAAGPDLGEPGAPVPAEAIVRTVIPTPAVYGGMPADRFWEFEDGTVAFGGLSTGRTDLARLLLAEFALAYGNDWFVIPVDLPVGSICAIDQVEVTDTFGEVTLVGRSGVGERWTMFEPTAPGPDHLRGLFFLPPVLARTDESDALEEVALFRDEMANLVWGVERKVQGGSGRPVDRYEEHQRELMAEESQSITGDIGQAELVYRLSTYVPDHWCPFVPVRADGTTAADGIIDLERRSLVRIAADGSVRVVEPRGRFMRGAEPMRIHEEEVPRTGVVLRRRWELTRWTAGQTVLWLGARKQAGRGEGSSGLRFDVASPQLD